MQILVDEKFFEHLLNCLSTQRFLPKEDKYNQKIIDQAWIDGIKMITSHMRHFPSYYKTIVHE